MDHPEAKTSSSLDSKIILVVGMHRSGTSVLAHAISLMGAFVGEERELVPPHPSINPTGFWERTDVIAEHDRFLKDSGCSWATIANFSLEKVAESRRHNLAGNLRSIVGTMRRHDSTLAIKDPRLCLTLPVWHEFVAAPAHVVIVRDPRKIAASLMAAFPESFTTDFLLALWQKYLRCALAALAGKRALFVSYARLLEEPEAEQRRLWLGLNAQGCARLPRFDARRLRSVIDGRFDRSAPSGHARLSDDQQRLYAWLLDRCESEGVVEIADIPTIECPDSALLELESVRRSCMRGGWNMAVQNGATASTRPMLSTA